MLDLHTLSIRFTSKFVIVLFVAGRVSLPCWQGVRVDCWGWRSIAFEKSQLQKIFRFINLFFQEIKMDVGDSSVNY